MRSALPDTRLSSSGARRWPATARHLSPPPRYARGSPGESSRSRPTSETEAIRLARASRTDAAQRSMFGGVPLRLYSYGMHTCANGLRGSRPWLGRAASIPREGSSGCALRGLRARRAPSRRSAAGASARDPRADDGRRPAQRVRAARPAPGRPVRSRERASADARAALPYRFFDAGSACVSRARPAARGSSTRRTAPGRPAAPEGRKPSPPPSARRPLHHVGLCCRLQERRETEDHGDHGHQLGRIRRAAPSTIASRDPPARRPAARRSRCASLR